jgi:hypothetical protein
VTLVARLGDSYLQAVFVAAAPRPGRFRLGWGRRSREEG